MLCVVNIALFKQATQRHINNARNTQLSTKSRAQAEEYFLRNMRILDKHYNKKAHRMILNR